MAAIDDQTENVPGKFSELECFTSLCLSKLRLICIVFFWSESRPFFTNLDFSLWIHLEKTSKRKEQYTFLKHMWCRISQRFFLYSNSLCKYFKWNAEAIIPSFTRKLLT